MALATPPAAQPFLSWTRQDIEQRLGFTGGGHTRVNQLLTLLIAAGMTVAFFAAMYPLRSWYVAQTFTQRGPIPYAICFFTAWGMAILFIKWRKLALQRRALRIAVVPSDRDFVLSSQTVDDVLRNVAQSVDDPRRFVLFNRLLPALSNLRNLGRVSDVDDTLRSQADNDVGAMETSYSVLQGLVWAIPVLGFIGTVQGLSQAIGAFTEVLATVNEVEQLLASLKGVTVGLAVAFETTLQGLVAALSLQMILTFLKKSEEEFLDECSEYCIRHVVGRLRVMPFEREVE